MDRLNQFEKNVFYSFQKVKNDFLKCQNDIGILTQNQNKIIEWMHMMKDREEKLMEEIKSLKEKLESKKVKSSKKIIASKTGKKAHNSDCVYAKKIKGNMKISFDTKTEAEKSGYKLCECLL
ncbi:hypothetical protein KY334_01910 [Candidatus Woesearchaeota archaeon]|nr:hypothetical protein [Candidatus Woesearchaeota archaeon]